MGVQGENPDFLTFWKLGLLIFGCCHFKITQLNAFLTSAATGKVQATLFFLKAVPLKVNYLKGFKMLMAKD